MNEYIPIITAIITLVGSVVLGKWSNKTTLTKTNIENANLLYERYVSINQELSKEVVELKKEMADLREKITQTELGFNEEKHRFRAQIDAKEQIIKDKNKKIDKLNDIITEKDKTIMAKDLTIERLKGGEDK